MDLLTFAAPKTFTWNVIFDQIKKPQAKRYKMIIHSHDAGLSKDTSVVEYSS